MNTIDFTINGHRYTNDALIAQSAGIPPEFQFIGYNATQALESYAQDIVAVGGGSSEAAVAAAALAQQFAASAVAAPGTSATSSTSLTTAYGPQSLFVEPGKVLNLGSWVTLASAAQPDEVQMAGPLTTYNSATGALGVNIKSVSGIGLTAADWIIALSAPGGAGLGFNQYTGSQFYAGGVFEGYVDLGAGGAVDLSKGTFFKKNVTANWALSIVGVPDGAAASFTLKVINGGQATTTLPAGSQFSNGLAPTFSFVGVERLHFVREPGGAWEIYVIGTAVKEPGT